MDLRDYVSILQRRKWVIISTVAATLLVIAGGTYMITPKYTATTTLRVSTTSRDQVDYGTYMYADRLMNTIAYMASSEPVVEEVEDRLGIENQSEIDVNPLPNSELLQISFQHEDKIKAAMGANEIAQILLAENSRQPAGGGKSSQDILREQLDQLAEEIDVATAELSNLIDEYSGEGHPVIAYTDSVGVLSIRHQIELKQETYDTVLRQYEQARVEEALQSNAISVIEPAKVPEFPSSPNWILNIAAGVILALVGGFGLAFLFEYLENTSHVSEQIETPNSLVPDLRISPTRGDQDQNASLDGLPTNAPAYD